MEWLLLIYTVPSQPSRKRVYVWRELKKLGVVYLRDGVALLPDRTEVREHLQAITERIVADDGSAELVLSPRFAGERDDALVARFHEERLAEYRELHHAGVRFLRDVLEEVDTEDFGFPDVENLESELGRLRRWFDQIQARDYFASPGSERVRDTLHKCGRAFERFSSEALGREDAPETEDVFERLGGRPATAEERPL